MPAEPPPEPPGRGGGPRPGQGPRPLNSNQDQYSSFGIEYFDLLFHVSILIAFDAWTVDKQAMKIFLAERTFWRNVLERLIDIVIFWGERNLVFRGSDETLGSPQNGNFLGLFELLAK